MFIHVVTLLEDEDLVGATRAEEAPGEDEEGRDATVTGSQTTLPQAGHCVV